MKKKLNIPKHVRLYDATRHSIISQLLNKGSSIYFVSKLAGHGSTRITEAVYGHENIDNLRIELSKLSVRQKAKVIELGERKESVSAVKPSPDRPQVNYL